MIRVWSTYASEYSFSLANLERALILSKRESTFLASPWITLFLCHWKLDSLTRGHHTVNSMSDEIESCRRKRTWILYRKYG